MKEKYIKKKSSNSSRTNWEYLRKMRDKDIDYRDNPPTNAKFWEGATVATRPKTHLSIRLDSDIVAYFKKGGPYYQSRINDVLREHLKAQGEPTPPLTIAKEIVKTTRKKK